MATELERRLREFVDRTDEMAEFCRLLDSPSERPVMAVWGRSGIGKSSLIARMLHECALRNAQRAELIYTADNTPGYVDIMRKCRDDLGLTGFDEFTDLVNYYTVEHYTLNVNIHGADGIRVGEGMNAQGATVGQMSGITIRDIMISQPRSDLSVSDDEKRSRLTKAFVKGLAARKGQLIVMFFDAAEKMSSSTASWLWEQLIKSVTDLGLEGVRFVVCGIERPSVSRWTQQLVVMRELLPLKESDVVEYLIRRGYPEEDRLSVARTLHRINKGAPLAIALDVDSLLEPSS